MASKSMIDVAYQVVVDSGKEMSFADILAAVGRELQLSAEQMNKKAGYFYTALSLDGRFVTLGENMWDLRSRRKYETVHIDMNDVYSDDDEKVEELGEEDEEEKKTIETGEDEDDNTADKVPPPDINQEN